MSGELVPYVSQVEGDLQVPPKRVGEAGEHVQHLQEVVPLDALEVTVGQGTHVCVGLPWLRVQGLPEDVVLL